MGTSEQQITFPFRPLCVRMCVHVLCECQIDLSKIEVKKMDKHGIEPIRVDNARFGSLLHVGCFRCLVDKTTTSRFLITLVAFVLDRQWVFVLHRFLLTQETMRSVRVARNCSPLALD